EIWLAGHHGEGFGAEAAKLDVPASGPLTRVPLESCALEVLHRIRLAVVRVLLFELLADREAKDGQVAELLPVGPEAAREVVTGRGEEDRLGIDICRCGLAIPCQRT